MAEGFVSAIQPNSSVACPCVDNRNISQLKPVSFRVPALEGPFGAPDVDSPMVYSVETSHFAKPKTALNPELLRMTHCKPKTWAACTVATDSLSISPKARNSIKLSPADAGAP